MKTTTASKTRGVDSKTARAIPSPAKRAAAKSAAPGEAAAPWIPGTAPLTVSRRELLDGGTDRDFRRLVHGLFPFLAVHTAIRDGYAAILGVTGPQYTIMLCIRNLCAAGPVSVKIAADHLRLSGSYLTAETKALEASGLVCKERGAEDRRMVSLSLTPKGAALLDSIAELRQQVNDVQFGCLSNEEFKSLVPLIERLIPSGERALALQSYLAAQLRASQMTRRGDDDEGNAPA
jgi:DNA-binding MarR family transcriptional regulator